MNGNNAIFLTVVVAVATDTSTKSETQNQIPLQVLSNKNEIGNENKNENEKVLESDGSKVQDPSPPVANSYMNNLFSISSSVIKRAQGTSAAQYLQVRTCFITEVLIHLLSYHVMSKCHAHLRYLCFCQEILYKIMLC